MKFDSEAARRLDDAYQGSDFVRRRLASFTALAPRTGERVLDIGCGPGFFTLELARAVGDSGEVTGIDPSPDMLETARTRCAGRTNVRIVEGTANGIPLDDASIDRAASIQVFEYVTDLAGALEETHRVLKPGGRLVIADLHFDSLVWHSDDRERMNRMFAAWDHHVAERGVSALLPPLMREAGYAVENVEPFTCTDTSLRSDGLANMMMHLMPPFVVKRGLMPKPEVAAWSDEQRALAAQGRFFFSLTQFVVTATKV